MKAIRNAAVGVLFLSSYALAASQIAFTLGMQDAAGTAYANYLSAWKNPASCNPSLFPAGSSSPQSFNAGSVLTWDARVAVSGTHSNGFVPSGAANIVFNLELQQESSPGSGVWTTVPFPAGGTTTAGWFSKINDGTSGACQTARDNPANEIKLAAAAVGYTLNSANGRVIDLPTDGGPYVNYHQYPSAAGFPTGSTAPTGKLLGCGAGYSKYNSVANPGGLNTAGVGVASGSASCAAALGTGSVFEGQMNTTGLAAGSYRLVLTPGTGCNVLDVSFNCTGADPGKFALKPDLTSQGATLNFTLTTVQTNTTITAWRSLKTHSGYGEIAMVLNAAATATGQTGGGIKVESRNSVAQNGITKIEVAFANAVAVADPGQVTVTGLSTSGCNTSGANCVSAVKTVTPAPTVAMTGPTTMTITFANGSAAGDTCYIITIGAGTVDATITGDVDCKVRMLQSDSTGDGLVALADLSQIKSRFNQAITATNCSSDQNLAAGIGLADISQTKSRFGRRALCP